MNCPYIRDVADLRIMEGLMLEAINDAGQNARTIQASYNQDLYPPEFGHRPVPVWMMVRFLAKMGPVLNYTKCAVNVLYDIPWPYPNDVREAARGIVEYGVREIRRLWDMVDDGSLEQYYGNIIDDSARDPADPAEEFWIFSLAFRVYAEELAGRRSHGNLGEGYYDGEEDEDEDEMDEDEDENEDEA